MWGPCGHVASPNLRKIKGWWIKWIRVILSTNGNWTCGNEGTRGIKQKRKEKFSSHFAGSGSGGGKSNSRERKFNFFLDLLAFGPSVLVGPRSKIVLRCKGYSWASFLGSFNKLREVGVFSYLI